MSWIGALAGGAASLVDIADERIDETRVERQRESQAERELAKQTALDKLREGRAKETRNEQREYDKGIAEETRERRMKWNKTNVPGMFQNEAGETKSISKSSSSAWELHPETDPVSGKVIGGIMFNKGSGEVRPYTPGQVEPTSEGGKKEFTPEQKDEVARIREMMESDPSKGAEAYLAWEKNNNNLTDSEAIARLAKRWPDKFKLQPDGRVIYTPPEKEEQTVSPLTSTEVSPDVARREAEREAGYKKEPSQEPVKAKHEQKKAVTKQQKDGRRALARLSKMNEHSQKIVYKRYSRVWSPEERNRAIQIMQASRLKRQK